MNVSVATSPLFLSRVLTMVTSCPPVAVILLVPLRILRRHCSVSSRMPVCRAYFVFDFSSSSPVGCRRGRARAPPPPQSMFGAYLQICTHPVPQASGTRRSHVALAPIHWRRMRPSRR
jgi:hypothetical protein